MSQNILLKYSKYEPQDRSFKRRRRSGMRLSYHPETDSLYIHLTEKPGADAGKLADLSRLETDGL